MLRLLNNGPPADRVVVAYTDSPPPQTWVLVDGEMEGYCENDLVKSDEVADFEFSNISPHACNEITAFAEEHAVVFDGDPPFTLNADVVTEDAAPPLLLEVNLWVVVSDGTPAADVWADLETVFVETQALLDANRVGVTLLLPSADGTWQSLATWVWPTGRLLSPGDPARTIGANCTESGVNGLKNDPSLYDPNRLNLYVVDYVLDGNGANTGQHEILCAFDAVTQDPLPSGHDIIYFSRLSRMNASLAHVLGHAFSLLGKTWGAVGDGHTGCWWQTYIAGFANDNIMWACVPAGTDPRKTFSLGQVYRMTLDDDSWLIKSGLRAPTTKLCPDDPAGDDPCPPLALSWWD